MTKSIFGVFLLFFIFLASYRVSGETLVFQNGVNDYSGCEDTYIQHRTDGLDESLKTKNYSSDLFILASN